MKMTNGLISMMFLCALSSPAFAKVDFGFLKSSPAEVAALAGDGIVNSFDLKTTDEWEADVVQDTVLFEGFKSFDTWDTLQDTNLYVIYGSEMAFVVPKNVTQADLDRLNDPSFLSEVDSTYTFTPTSAAEANQTFQDDQAAMAKKAKLSAQIVFDEGKIDDARRNSILSQVDAQLALNSQGKFCEAGASCMKASALIPTAIKALMIMASAVSNKIPSEVAGLFESRSIPNDQLGSAKAGILQTGFWANKALVSVKNKILAYDLGDGRTLITLKTLISIEKDDLDDVPVIDAVNFLLGESDVNNPDGEGIVKGLPEAGLDTARALKEKL